MILLKLREASGEDLYINTDSIVVVSCDSITMSNGTKINLEPEAQKAVIECLTSSEVVGGEVARVVVARKKEIVE